MLVALYQPIQNTLESTAPTAAEQTLLARPLSDSERAEWIGSHLNALQKLHDLTSVSLDQLKACVVMEADSSIRAAPELHIERLMHQLGRSDDYAIVFAWPGDGLSALESACQQATFALRQALEDQPEETPVIKEGFVKALAAKSTLAARSITVHAECIAAALCLLHQNGIKASSFSSMYAGQFFEHRIEKTVATMVEDVERLLQDCKNGEDQVIDSLYRSICGMQNRLGMISKEDFDRLSQLSKKPDGQIDEERLRSITNMQSGLGMMSKEDCALLEKLFKKEDGDWDYALLRSIASMQNGKGMIAEEDLNQLKDWVSDANDKLDYELLSSICGMQNSRGMISKPDFDRLMKACTNKKEIIDWRLLRSITSMQSSKGMLTDQQAEQLKAWFATTDGPFDYAYLSAYTSMQNCRGMVHENTFRRLTGWCDRIGGDSGRALFCALGTMQAGKGMPSEGEFKTLDRLYVASVNDFNFLLDFLEKRGKRGIPSKLNQLIKQHSDDNDSLDKHAFLRALAHHS